MAKRESDPRGEQRFMSRKHLSRAERDPRQRQQVVIGTTAVVGLVLVILAAGLLYQAFVSPGQAMATVYGEPITREELYKRINYQRHLTFQEFQQARDQYVETAASPESSFLSQIYGQQVQQLQNYYLSLNNQTLEVLIEDRVVQKLADERGVTVSEEEIDEEIRRRIATEQGAQIEVDVTATAEGYANATATAAQFTPTPEPTLAEGETITETETIAEGETVTETETITETEPLTPTMTPMPTPTPNILSDDDFETSYQSFLRGIESNTGVTEAEYRELVRLDLLRQKVQEAVEESAEIEETEEQVHVRHILVETEEEAQEVQQRLEEGERFEIVAQEVSLDTGSAQNGGDLDWISREAVVQPFAEAAFALAAPGERSEPVQTEFGWHIIELVEGPEERPISAEREQQLRTQAWNGLLQQERISANVLYEWDVDDVPRDRYIDEITRPLPTPVPMPTTEPQATVPVTVEPSDDAGAEAAPANGADTETESDTGSAEDTGGSDESSE